MPHEFDVAVAVGLGLADAHLFGVPVLDVAFEPHLHLLLESESLQVVDYADLVAPLFVVANEEIACQNWLVIVILSCATLIN